MEAGEKTLIKDSHLVRDYWSYSVAQEAVARFYKVVAGALNLYANISMDTDPSELSDGEKKILAAVLAAFQTHDEMLRKYRFDLIEKDRPFLVDLDYQVDTNIDDADLNMTLTIRGPMDDDQVTH